MKHLFLPSEIISLIIQHVNKRDFFQCAVINKHFYAGVYPLLWRTIFIQHQVTARKFIHCLKNAQNPVGQQIRSINLSILAWTDNDLFRLIPHLSQLETLVINNGQQVTNTSFQLLPRQCPNLRSLRLHNSPITHTSIEALGQHCHQLGELDLADCDSLSPHTFSALAACPLKIISLRTTSHNGGTSWMTAVHTAVDLGTKFPQLISLMICTNNGGEDDDGDGGVDGDFTRRLLQTATWPDLHVLSLDTCHSVDDAILIPFFQSHTLIKDLTLQSSQLSDTTLDAIADYLPDVAHMDLSWSLGHRLSARGLRRCVRRCLSLQSVYVLKCGLPSAAFPEVENDIFASSAYGGGRNRYGDLVELNQSAIDAIRVGPNPPAQQLQQQYDAFMVDLLGIMVPFDIDRI